MSAVSPLLTAEEAAAIARCSVKTVRRAYSSGALTAYRRGGSRAVLLDPDDVRAWAQAHLLGPTESRRASTSSARQHRPSMRRREHADPAVRSGHQLRFDLSSESLRDRRSSTEPRR
jgi:excisionase family DNA binding protein